MKSFLMICVLIMGIANQENAVRGQNMEQRIDELLQDVYPGGEPGCVALVTRQNQVLYNKAFGLANLELNIPMRTEMVFEIGSLTKQFTSVSTLMLIEQGRAGLSDPISKYLDFCPDAWKSVTIRHLLNHTSGIKDLTSMEILSKVSRHDHTPREVIALFEKEPLDFQPGESWNYSNSGYVILGYIIEKITGQEYGNFITENIFKPLKMNNSFYGNWSGIIKNRVSGYQKKGSLINADYLSFTLPYSAGALMMTAEDFYTWNQALHTYQIVKKETLDQAFVKSQLNNGSSTDYGYGWFISEMNSSRAFEHSGGIYGQTSFALYLPAEQILVVMFTNRDDRIPAPFAKEIAAIVVGKEVTSRNEEVEVNLTPETLQKYAGEYEIRKDLVLSVSLKNEQLFIQPTGQPKLKIIPVSQTAFTVKMINARVEFITNSTGQAESLLLYQGDKKIPARKIK